MVQKHTRRSPGRPRDYDADTALLRALQTFWHAGYSGTSLDQLSDAMDMNRPSMYAAFGDKHSLYVKTLKRYTEDSRAAIDQSLQYDRPLAEALRTFYEHALASYLPSGAVALGCYLIGTATTEAAADE